MTTDTPPATRAPKFPLRRYEVTVRNRGTGVYLATSRGKALADAWRCDAFDGYTFGEFLKMASCRLSAPDHQPKPDVITVSGEECWGLGHNGQYVLLVRFGGDRVLYSHPLDVLPVSYRPEAYQRAAA